MAAPLTRRSWRIPGRLVQTPTDLDAVYPYGGTELGLVGRETFALAASHHPIRAEEWGRQVVDVIDGGVSPTFGFDLRGFDIDAISAVFPDTAAGSKVHSDTRERVISLRTTDARAGSKLGDRSFPLLFVPDDRDTKPAILLPDAVPVLAEDGVMRLDAENEIVIGVVFYARPTSAGRVAQIGIIRDLTL
jgi:hypothetical protein